MRSLVVFLARNPWLAAIASAAGVLFFGIATAREVREWLRFPDTPVHGDLSDAPAGWVDLAPVRLDCDTTLQDARGQQRLARLDARGASRAVFAELNTAACERSRGDTALRGVLRAPGSERHRFLRSRGVELPDDAWLFCVDCGPRRSRTGSLIGLALTLVALAIYPLVRSLAKTTLVD